MSESWHSGMIHSVPCPWCSARNDFRGTEEFLFDGMTGDPATRSQPTFSCDSCKGLMEVVQVQRTVVVSVRKA